MLIFRCFDTFLSFAIQSFTFRPVFVKITQKLTYGSVRGEQVSNHLIDKPCKGHIVESSEGLGGLHAAQPNFIDRKQKDFAMA